LRSGAFSPGPSGAAIARTGSGRQNLTGRDEPVAERDRVILDLLIVVAIVMLVAALLRSVAGIVTRTQVVRRSHGGPSRKPRYEWEPRYTRYSRRAKGVQLPSEDRAGMMAFIETRRSVEAYIEPKTVMHPLSVVLVAEDGEWRRFELGDDAFVREVAGEHHLPVLDAARTGYPERMRRYRRSGSPGDA
jgi:hypothetical protein